jgi:hypothetical protein
MAVTAAKTAYWHFSAVPTAPSNVGFQGKAAVPQKS